MKFFITKEQLNNELKKTSSLEDDLRLVQRQVGEVTTQSSETWHDNAPYDVLKTEISIKNRRLNEMHNMLRKYEVKEYPKKLDLPIVQYGTRVIFLKDNREFDLRIVGFGDNDVSKGNILYLSPLAKILIDHKEGDIFSAELNSKISTFEIKKVFLI